MIFHPRDALVGLGLYLAVCLVALGAGNGLLKLLRVQLEDRLRFFFAPVAALLLWVLALGLAGAVGWPLKFVCPPIWAVTLVLFVYGCWRGPRMPLASLPFVVLCALLPVLGMAKAFAFGLLEYAPTLTSDGWNYIAVARYFWDFGRVAVEGLPAFYDSGLQLVECRYLSPSLIALLSVVREPGETICMGTLLQAFALYCAASAVVFFWQTQQRPAWFTVAATAVTILCGWVLRAVWVSNYDNTVFLFFMPAMAGLLAVMPAGDRAYRVLLGLMIAAAGYLYVECFLLAMAGALFLTAPRFWHERAQWRSWLAAGAVSFALGAVLLLPVARMLTGFFLHQLHAVRTQTSGRGGEGLVPDVLTRRHFLVGAWSLSGYAATTAPEKYRRLCAAGLTALLGLGLCQLVRERRWGMLLCLGFFGVGVVHMVFSARYDYGVYKLLNLSWWCLAGVLVGGVDWLIRLGRTDYLRPVLFSALALAAVTFAYLSGPVQPTAAWWYAGAGLLIGAEWLVCCRAQRYFSALVASAFVPLALGYVYLSQATVNGDHSGFSTERLSDFRQTKALRRIVGTEPVLDASDDWLNCLVSRYHLRDLNCYPLLCRGITRFGLPPLRDARPCEPRTRHLITDTSAVLGLYLSEVAERRAVLGSYTLWELPHRPHGATVVSIDNPWGVENHRNLVHFWLCREKAEVWVLAAQDGVVLLDCSFDVGPCGPPQPVRALKLTTAAGFTEQLAVAAGRRELAVPVRAGLNRLDWQVLDAPVRLHSSATDHRTLLLLAVLHGTRFVPAAESPRSAGESKLSVRSTPLEPLAAQRNIGLR